MRTAVVGIWAGGLQARTVVTFSDGPWNPARFFAELAADWRGWAGERRWRALEGEMDIEASHDGRAHVLVAVTVKRAGMTFAPDAWSARIVFALEAGEQLAGVARDLASVPRLVTGRAGRVLAPRPARRLTAPGHTPRKVSQSQDPAGVATFRR